MAACRIQGGAEGVQIGVVHQIPSPEGHVVDTDLDTLATAPYVSTDDLLRTEPGLAPWRPQVEIAPQISDAERITLVGDCQMNGVWGPVGFIGWSSRIVLGR